MTYSWVKFLHVAAVFGLLASHGVSMFVLYAIRKERDRKKILDLISLSGLSIGPMYVSILLIVLAGAWLWWKVYPLDTWWLWIAVTILVLTIGLMNATAKPYFARVKEACQMRPSGVPRVSDEELGDVLGSARAHLITAIGVIGLLAILYLMIFKPRF